jgi:multimeric flavodoxin WrbA/putative sterol carrier protein
MNSIIKSIPFIAVIALNVLAQAARYKIDMLTSYILIIALILLINLIIAFISKKITYFTFGISSVALLGCICVFIFPDIGQFYIEHIIEGLYLGLFIVAFFPPLLKLEPFTFEFSKKNYPEAITNGQQFLTINLIINYIWAGIFALALILTMLPYHPDKAINTIIATFFPIALQLAIGIPVVVKLPNYLMQKVGREQLNFKSIKDLFSAMPFGLNKEKAKNINTVIQFYLTGEEAATGYIIIKDQKCTYTEGEHPNPKAIIKCDSKLWLQISNNEVSGDKAFMNKEYEVEGDATIMLKFADMFAPPKKIKKQKHKKTEQTKIKFEYKSFEPNKIKNIAVFDGGPRNKNHSKTTFMVDNFTNGAKSAGAAVDYFKLSKHKIHHCVGCYTCWTKTPGECIFKDDMTELRKKCREADLVIFASPLYIFNVTGIMKSFMDRLLPLMKPYMLTNEKGDTMHPDRFPEKGEQGFVVFSAAGFPDIDNNFNGLKEMYRCWSSHSENAHLMGEFFLTAAEIIAHPVYADRKKLIKDICFKAGKQVVEEGKIDKDLMFALQDPTISKETFQMQSDNFWETLDGKERYLKKIPKLTHITNRSI